MANLIEAITSPLRTAGDLVKGIVEVRDQVKLGELQVKLQAEIMSALQGATAAQSHELEMGNTIRELENRVMELETWEAEKKRYQLEKLPPGVIVRTLKQEFANGDPAHHICENCYQDGKASPLHADEPGNGIYHLTCNRCKATLTIGHYIRPSVRMAADADYNPFERS